MSEQASTAFQAAKALAAELALPSSRASVFAWHTDLGDKIVISGDTDWLTARRAVPAVYLGFPVEVTGYFDASAQPSTTLPLR